MTAPGYTSPNSAFQLPLLQVVSISGQPRRLTASSQSLNHDQLAKLRCHRTVSLEQSSRCSRKTEDDAAYFQVTTEELSILHLMR